MALKDLFKMAKADKYTADGREELMEARKAETEDRTYNIGEISEKTGLQKTANGWRPPKKGVAPGTKSGVELIKRDQIKKQADFEKKIGDPAKAREQYWKEIKESSENKPDSAEKHAKAMENAKKVGIVSKVPEGWKKAEGVTTAPNGYVAITNGGSHFPKEGQQKKEIKFIKEEDFNYDDFMKEHKKREFQELYGDAIKFDEYGLPSKETVELKENFLRKKGISDPNKLSNKEFNDLAKELDDQFGINNLERSQELLVATPDEENTTSNPYEMTESEKKQAMKDPKTRLSQKYDAVKKAQKGSPEYDKALTEYLKERDIFKQEQGSDAVKEFPVTPESKPSAPKDAAYTAQSVNAPREKLERTLTGDTKIRVRR